MATPQNPYGYFMRSRRMMRPTATCRRNSVIAMRHAANALLQDNQIFVDVPLERAIDRLLQAAHAHQDDAVAVAGPAAGDAMCALWRRGFDRVEAARHVTSACADQLSDVLLILESESVDQVVKVVTAVLPILRRGGVLAVDAGSFTREERARLCRMLAQRGFRQPMNAHLKSEIIASRPEAVELALAS